MKKLLVLMLVLGIASAANAGLVISVDGELDPPDSSIILMPSDYVTIDVSSDGQTNQEMPVFLTIVGPGSLDISAGTVYGELGVPNETLVDMGDGMYYIDLLKDVVVPIPPIPEGVVVDLIEFHCEDLGDVTLLLGMEPGSGDYDIQVIHQIPEPMTIALLGLGGLLLRRRK